MCDAVSQSGQVFFTCPYCMLSSYFVMMNATARPTVIDRGFLFQILSLDCKLPHTQAPPHAENCYLQKQKHALALAP